MKPVLRITGVLVTLLLVSIILVADNNKIAKISVKKNENVVELRHINANLVKQTYEEAEKLAANEILFADIKPLVEEVIEEDVEEAFEPIVYKGMTQVELAKKLNRSLKSSLSGKGELFASYSIANGVDPYLAISIVLLETGCASGNCSNLVNQCNNVGGQKGSGARCGSSSYAAFATLDIGIMRFIDNLAKNYIKQGLVTPEQMNSKYAESNTWAQKVRSYMIKIENS